MADNQASINLLDEISAFCSNENMAESTFGRRSVNDGKFVSRLKDGARVTPETWDKVIRFMEQHGWRTNGSPNPSMLHLVSPTNSPAGERNSEPESTDGSQKKNFRFFDNRQKYLLFVNTCSEKEIVCKTCWDGTRAPTSEASGAPGF